MMGIEEILRLRESSERFIHQEFKDVVIGSAVQDILKGSEEVQDIQLQQNADSDGSIAPRFLGQNVSELSENLILCSASAINASILEGLNISCVVNVAAELPDTPLHNNADVIYHKIDVLDASHSRILPHFDEAADLINKVAQAGGKSLVYCVAGVSRSASICLAYLMKHHQLSLLEAYNYVKLRRPRIKPNCGFFKQLIDYEKSLFGCNSVSMVFNEFVQMEIPEVYDCEYRLLCNYSKKRRGQNCRR